jgi:hypothetical protein
MPATRDFSFQVDDSFCLLSLRERIEVRVTRSATYFAVALETKTQRTSMSDIGYSLWRMVPAPLMCFLIVGGLPE